MNSKWDPSMAKFYGDVYASINGEKPILMGDAYIEASVQTSRDLKLTWGEQQAFSNVVKELFNQEKSSIFNKRREDMMNMLTDPKTGKELYVDLTMAEKYNFDNDRAYSVEHGEALRILTRFEARPEEKKLDMVSRLMHQTTQLEEKRQEIDEETMAQVLYNLIYDRKEFDMLAHPHMKQIYDDLLKSLIEGKAAFLDDMKTYRGIGIAYDNRNTIVNFFNEVSITMKSTHINKENKKNIININDSDQRDLDCVFYTNAFPNNVIFFTESHKARFVNVDKLPAEIKAALPIIQEEEAVEKAGNLSENRQYFYDTIINPIREVSRKESIASQFADIDFDL